MIHKSLVLVLILFCSTICCAQERVLSVKAAEKIAEKKIKQLKSTVVAEKEGCQCVSSQVKDKYGIYKINDKHECGLSLQTVEYDGCEYVLALGDLDKDGHPKFSITHKGDCKYCKMRREQQWRQRMLLQIQLDALLQSLVRR